MCGAKKIKCINAVNLRIIIFVCLSLLIFGYIIFNSTQGADASNEKSGNVSETVQSVVDPDKKINKDYFHEYTRKVAHGLEFAALGICIGGIFYNIYLKNGKKYVSMPLLIGLSTGVCDEFIQSFNKERSSEVRDILIDSGGVVFGLLLVFLTALLIYKRKKKKEN